MSTSKNPKKNSVPLLNLKQLIRMPPASRLPPPRDDSSDDSSEHSSFDYLNANANDVEIHLREKYNRLEKDRIRDAANAEKDAILAQEEAEAAIKEQKAVTKQHLRYLGKRGTKKNRDMSNREIMTARDNVERTQRAALSAREKAELLKQQAEEVIQYNAIVRESQARMMLLKDEFKREIERVNNEIAKKRNTKWFKFRQMFTRRPKSKGGKGSRKKEKLKRKYSFSRNKNA